MDLFKFLKELKKHKKALILASMLGGLVGTAIYFLPQKYNVEGSFFIGRESDNSSQFFTYEGYYSQSNAALFTDTVVALVESPDIKKSVLEELKLPVTTENLRKIDKYTSVKRPGAHIATIRVKSYNKDEAVKFWNAISKALQTKVNRLTTKSDTQINITAVSEEPLINQDKSILYVNILLGIMAGLTIYASGLFIKLNWKLR